MTAIFGIWPTTDAYPHPSGKPWFKGALDETLYHLRLYLEDTAHNSEAPHLLIERIATP